MLNDNGSVKDIVFNGKANVDVTDDDGSGSDGTHVRKYPRGTLDVTSTDKLDALDVADAIRTFLNDSRIEDVDDNASTGKASQAAEDFAEFLRALHESGAEVISYTWDDDLTHRGSRWSNTDGDTLVKKVVAEPTTFFATASNTRKTITLTVDGNPMNFTIEVPAGS